MMMYRKPVILKTDDMFEGIYAESGAAVSSNNDNAVYSLKQTNAWDGNKQYAVTFTNLSSERVDSVSVTMTAHGDVTSISGNVSGTVSGGQAVVTFNNYGNGIEGNAVCSDIYMAVTGTGDFWLE